MSLRISAPSPRPLRENKAAIPCPWVKTKQPSRPLSAKGTRSPPPEMRREQHQQGEHFQPAEQHAEAHDPLGGVRDGRDGYRHLAEARAEVVDAGAHGREGGGDV